MANKEFLEALEQAHEWGLPVRIEHDVDDRQRRRLYICFVDEEGMTEYDVEFIEEGTENG